MKNFKLVFVAFIFVVLAHTNSLYAFSDKSKNLLGIYELKQGLLAHDRGWFGTNREGFGPDYIFELMFNSPNFMNRFWSPKPILGLKQTSSGGSSLYYGGLTWDFKISEKWFFSGTTGIAYTNGLTKLNKGAVPTGDKKIQFGSKILHRGALEIGWNFYGKDTISLMFSHVSHASMLDEKNQGMDEFGIRYGYRF